MKCLLKITDCKKNMMTAKEFVLVELEDMFVTIPSTWYKNPHYCVLPNFEKFKNLKKMIASYMLPKENWIRREILNTVGFYGNILN